MSNQKKSEIYYQKAEDALRILREEEAEKNRIAVAGGIPNDGENKEEAEEAMAESNYIIEWADTLAYCNREKGRQAEMKEKLKPITKRQRVRREELEEIEESVEGSSDEEDSDGED